MRRNPVPASTGRRGEILALLCDSSRTVSDLADALAISRNAVREHLARLEAEELVRYEVVRRGVGKPAHEYSLTAEGERVLSRAYLPLLLRVLDSLGERLDEPALLALMEEVGRRMAAGGNARGGLRARVEAARAFLGELGGAGRVEQRDGAFWIVSSCCPIGAVVSRHPLACRAVEALVTELTGASAREACDRAGRPRCRLQVVPAAPPGG